MERIPDCQGANTSTSSHSMKRQRAVAAHMLQHGREAVILEGLMCGAEAVTCMVAHNGCARCC